jgi:antitoxin HigA-1
MIRSFKSKRPRRLFADGDAWDVDHVDYHEEKQAMAMKHPPHPGRIVREDCLPELGLTVGQAAQALGVSRQTLDKILNGRGGVTPEMAIRFEKVFGSSAETWLRLQLAFDLAAARLHEADIVSTVRRPVLVPAG